MRVWLFLGWFSVVHCLTTTPIRNLITVQAFTSSLSNIINREFTLDTSVLNDITQRHAHLQSDFMYCGILFTTLCIEYNYNEKNWKNISLYTYNRKIFQAGLLFLFFFLSRNVESVF